MHADLDWSLDSNLNREFDLYSAWCFGRRCLRSLECCVRASHVLAQDAVVVVTCPLLTLQGLAFPPIFLCSQDLLSFAAPGLWRISPWYLVITLAGRWLHAKGIVRKSLGVCNS
jgi:hypothetical protein